MYFSKQPKKLNDQSVFNPPPGYYNLQTSNSKKVPSFGKSQRFLQQQVASNPGPGTYNNNQKEIVRRRLIQQSQKRQIKATDSNASNNIKISSIPSIPKKSATRVYEQLAPGILILHEEQYENASIGPGSYNINDTFLHPKQPTYKIPPEKRIKKKEEQPEQVNIPTINQQIRNEKRMIYHRQNLIKSSTINKSQINPSDLCLEVIILREKLLRSDDNPPPGYYYNPNHSQFKKVQPDQRTLENQCLGGRQKRFIQANPPQTNEIGPGNYNFQHQSNQKGGFIPKSPRKINEVSQEQPGPGAYINEKTQQRIISKANYPPIFGSGCVRFASAPKPFQTSVLPGPGSYQYDKKKNKKQKYIKIRKDLLQQSKDQFRSQPRISLTNQFHNLTQKNITKQKKIFQTQKHSSSFASKVHRFQQKGIDQSLGPGSYNQNGNHFKSFNKKSDDYIGSRMARFDQTQLRPKIGPGTYNPAYDTVKQRKIANVFL